MRACEPEPQDYNLFLRSTSCAFSCFPFTSPAARKRKMGKCPSYNVCLIGSNKKREENTPSPHLPCYSAAIHEDSGCFLLRHNSVGSRMEKSISVSSDRNILDKLCLSQAFTKLWRSVENSTRKLRKARPARGSAFLFFHRLEELWKWCTCFGCTGPTEICSSIRFTALFLFTYVGNSEKG